MLYRVLGSHLETFIERTEAGDRELPGFVKHELRSFLACGIFAHGFARFRCDFCGHSRLVPLRRVFGIDALACRPVRPRSNPRDCSMNPSSTSPDAGGSRA